MVKNTEKNFTSKSILIPTKDKNIKILNDSLIKRSSTDSKVCGQEYKFDPGHGPILSKSFPPEKNLFHNKMNSNSKIQSDPQNSSLNSSVISKVRSDNTLNIDFSNIYNKICNTNFEIYDAINNCKSAGIIPYTLHRGKVHFLLQKYTYPLNIKDKGWNDFGGKRNPNEDTYQTAAREFNEETSCMFYLNEKKDKNSKKFYNKLAKNRGITKDEQIFNDITSVMPDAEKYFRDKINEFVIPLYVSSKETYISYFVKVDYIPDDDIPVSEDLHIPYEDRYIRICSWISIDDVLKMKEGDFHKRLQITKIQNRIKKYHNKEMFT